ncbi:MAG: putative zinc-binding metallopeptidase [Ilumatobacteraceae bacterium]
MQAFHCSVCGQLVFFDNSDCLRCGSVLGFLADERDLVALTPVDRDVVRADGAGGRYRFCANQIAARCNWLIPASSPGSLCRSCGLTSVRPNDSEADAMVAFADAEAAKRRLIDQVLSLSLPIIDRVAHPDLGLTFEFLSSRNRPVSTGHEAGVITLDLSESDDAHREFVRQQLGEQYRTVLGHLRHEIGHYFWRLIVVDTGRLDEFRTLFGDERLPYQAALDQHYGAARSSEWSGRYVSQYATMHPWEDWAETFAHYLHIVDGLETARSFGLGVGEPARSAADRGRPVRVGRHVAVDEMVDEWLVLTLGLNAMSRSIGQHDLYPFVLSEAVVDKLDFVHRCVTDLG